MNNLKSRESNFLYVVIFTLALLFLAGNGFAQATLVTVNGRVLDEQGLPLPGASIDFRNVESGYVYSSITNAKGNYSKSGMEAGKYEAEVNLSGFAKALRKGMTFNVGARLTIDFTLQQQTLEKEVVVTAESPMVEITKSEISGVINREDIDNLPLLNRNFNDLSILQAGVQIDPTDTSDVRSNGLPWGMGEITVDGVSNEEMSANSARTAVPSDAVREFRVLTNQFAAEYGSAAGVIRTAITQSGTNDFRGRASFYYRNEAFGTPNYFISHDGYKGPDIKDFEKPKYKHLNPSGFLGGPIIKDKLHFFLSYEGFFKETYSQITSPLVPSETVAIPETTNNILAKLNYQLNKNNQFMLRFTYNNISRENSGAGGRYTKDWALDKSQGIGDAQLNWTSFISSSIVNELRFLYSRSEWSFGPSNPALKNAFAIRRPGGYSGKNMQAPQSNWTESVQLLDDLSVYVGAHSLKFGFDYNYAPGGGDISAYRPGYLIFATNAPFDSANPFTYPQVFVKMTGPTTFRLPQHIFALYAQDSWAVSPRLTFNYGIRYNLYTMDPLSIRKLNFPSNFTPRFGFSWDPIGDKKTSLRGGIGTFSANLFGNTSFQFSYMNGQKMLMILFPNYPDPNADNPYWPLWESILGMPPGYLSNQWDSAQSLQTYGIQKNMIAPYALQASLGIQREVLKDVSLSADFIYTRGYHLLTTEEKNPVIPGTGGIRQDPAAGSLMVVSDTGKSEFKGMYLSFSKRYSNGWSLDLSYTLGWSKANTEYMDAVESYDANGWDRRYGYTTTDARHTVTASGIVALPWGFQLSGIASYRSALPWTAYYGYDQNLDSLYSDYLDYRRNSRRGLDHFWINTRISKYINLNRLRLQLFAEVYNLTNHTNFIYFGTEQNSPDFGLPAQALDPRQLQIGIRVDF